MTFDIKNSGPGLGQAQKGGGVKLINGMPTLHRTCIESLPLKKKPHILYNIQGTMSMGLLHKNPTYSI